MKTKIKKLNFAEMGRTLTRAEMKEIIAGYVPGGGGGGGGCWGSWGTNNYCEYYPDTNWILCSDGEGFCHKFNPNQSPDFFCCQIQ